VLRCGSTAQSVQVAYKIVTRTVTADKRQTPTILDTAMITGAYT